MEKNSYVNICSENDIKPELKRIFKKNNIFIQEILKKINEKRKYGIQKALILSINNKLVNKKEIAPSNAQILFKEMLYGKNDTNNSGNRVINFKATLNIYNGSSNAGFLLKYGKFDMIIALNLYSNALKKRKKYLSALFFYKHFLRKNGFLWFINENPEKLSNKGHLLKNLTPLINQIEKTNIEGKFLHHLIYFK